MIVNQTIDDKTIYRERRQRLIELIKREKKGVTGTVLLLAGFEEESAAFSQESTFFYCTGIQEPGVALTIDLNGHTTLFTPAFKTSRSAWVTSDIDKSDAQQLKTLGIDAVIDLGEPLAGYALKPYASMEAYTHLISHLQNVEKIFTVCPSDSYQYVMQRFLLSRLCTQAPTLISKISDISSLIARMRRSKDMHEIEIIQHAVEITHMAQEVAMEALAEGITEAEIQAALEYVMIAAQSKPAFPSIVGSGKNSTVLHYMSNADVLTDGEVVVIDIGAKAEGYCADITRTYPVSGKFTERQKELYQLVLDTQEYIAQLAAPGIWLSNAEHPDQSLNHLAKKYLADRGGYDIYFPHGIGHFLGLDVHDVGDLKEPLAEGDVITIEPGIYIPEEKIGIRIEDNYWIVKGGAVCLSESIPKGIHEIEHLMAYGSQESSSDDEDDFEIDLGSFEDDDENNVH
jgi:Xaa-Pro aminopeptidase